MVGPVVVKFGGSLNGSPELGSLLDAVSHAGAIASPGGGKFADAVREAQTRAGLSDTAAHTMAILAMDQTALLLKDLAPHLSLCVTREDFANAYARGSGAIWRPSSMALTAELPHSWEVTSDSLAIWLAIALGSPRVVILKSAEVERDSRVETLAALGVIDAYAPILARRFAGQIEVLGRATASELSVILTTRRAA